MATFRRIWMYAPAQYAPRCNQQTVAAEEVGDIGVSGRVTSSPRVDLHAVSISRLTREQNQGRIQGQPATRINHCRAPNETTPRGDRRSNLEPDWQHAPFIAWSRGGIRKIFLGRKAFT